MYNEFACSKKEMKNDFLERIKIDENYKNPEIEKKKFINEITEDTNKLEKLSVNRLEMILQYYVEENNKKRAILNKLDC